jgi:hypothetical protein
MKPQHKNSPRRAFPVAHVPATDPTEQPADIAVGSFLLFDITLSSASRSGSS